MSLNVGIRGILSYNAVFRVLPAGLETHSLGWPPERQACKSWAAQNLAIYAQIGEQRSVLESEPFACCMSKSERIAKAVVVRGSRGDGREKRSAPDQASEWCTNKANDIISSSDLFDPARLSLPRPSGPLFRSPSAAPFRSLAPLSGRLSASPLLFPTPANAQHVVCP